MKGAAQQHDPSVSTYIAFQEPDSFPDVQKLAFFYQFKDNHIYNFEYEGTFIDELMDNGCILEMCKKGAMLPDEAMQSQVGFGNAPYS